MGIKTVLAALVAIFAASHVHAQSASNLPLLSDLSGPNTRDGSYTDQYFNYADGKVADHHVGRPRNVSQVSVHALLPEGSQTKIIAEVQGWFCHDPNNMNGGLLKSPGGPVGQPNFPSCGSHIDVGYNSADATRVEQQVEEMAKRGVDGVAIDWPGTDPQHKIVNGAVTSYFQAAARNKTLSGQPFTVSLIEDQAVLACAKNPGCNPTNQIISDLQAMKQNWMNKNPGIVQRTKDGRPVVEFFSVNYYAEKVANPPKKIDWGAIKKAHPDLALILQGNEGLNNPYVDGAFAWPQPEARDFCADCAQMGLDNLSGFYATHKAQQQAHAILGSAYARFDDSDTNGWHYGDGTRSSRYIDGRCGQTWLDTFTRANDQFPQGDNRLDAIMLATLDDYEEGTTLETGVDNCLTKFNASVSGSSLNFSVGFDKSPKGYPGSEQTVQGYEVYATPNSTDPNPRMVKLGDVPVTMKGNYSYDLSKFHLSPGTYKVMVRAIGKPYITNSVSNFTNYVVR